MPESSRTRFTDAHADVSARVPNSITSAQTSTPTISAIRKQPSRNAITAGRPGPRTSNPNAQRLTAADIEDLNHLYQLGFRTGFPISVVEDGLYYGVRVHGRLVSAAGTHLINPREGVAVVGNVMTHVDYRGHDFAKMVTSAVTAQLLQRVPDVALNVHAGNTPAVAAYARLGYGEYCQMVERLGRRRSGAWGLMRPIREAIRLTWQRDPR